MTIEKHDLVHDLPEHRESIHALKMEDAHFLRLFEEYHDVTHEVRDIEENNNNVSDDHIEALKHKRAHLKDALYAIILEHEK